MSLNPTTPAQRCRAAITSRLSDPISGFNPFLVACIAGTDPTMVGSASQPFVIDFSDDSLNYLHGKYNISDLFLDSEITLPAIAVYQGASRPAGVPDQLIGQTFSGFVAFGVEVHMMSVEGGSQTDFDQMVSAVHDAMMNAFNVFGATDYGSRQIVWNNDISMGQPSRLIDKDTGTYLSTLPFRISFYCPV
jgi:hypothetical protein